VRVEGVMALRSFVEELADVAALKPVLPQLMDSIFKLMNEVRATTQQLLCVWYVFWYMSLLVVDSAVHVQAHERVVCHYTAAACWVCVLEHAASFYYNGQCCRDACTASSRSCLRRAACAEHAMAARRTLYSHGDAAVAQICCLTSACLASVTEVV
jgi:hypothetical protein